MPPLGDLGLPFSSDMGQSDPFRKISKNTNIFHCIISKKQQHCLPEDTSVPNFALKQFYSEHNFARK